MTRIFVVGLITGCAAACTPRSAPPDAGELQAPEPVEDAGSIEDAGPGMEARLPTWQATPGIPPARSVHAAYASGSSLVVISGNHASGPIDDAWRWDGSTWHSMRSPCAARKNASVVVSQRDGLVLVARGIWSGGTANGYETRLLETDCVIGPMTSEERTGPAPSPRAGSAIAWDAQRGEAVLFGGTDNTVAFSDTWTWAPAGGWRQVLTRGGASPPARLNSRAVFDERRGVVVLFGGHQIGPNGRAVNLDDTWEWDGQAWREVTGLRARPPARGLHSMAWDGTRTVLFGGSTAYDPVPPSTVLGDLWTFDGSTWQEVTNVPLPPARTGAALTWIPERQRLVLSGGFVGFDLGDLWEWDGRGPWVERTLRPPARTAFGFAQAAEGPAVVFGGVVAGDSAPLGDSWWWDGSRWARLNPGAPAPSPRASPAVTMHGNRALLVGGTESGRRRSGDTWAWDGNSSGWVQVQAGDGPSARDRAALGFDPEADLSVLFGGRDANGAVLGDTHVFDGTRWSKLTQAGGPGPRALAQLVYHPGRRTLLLIGGIDAENRAQQAVWRFDRSSRRWERAPAFDGEAAARIFAASSVDRFGRLWRFGGLSPQGIHDEAFVHDGQAWQRFEPSGPSARFDAAFLRTGSGLELLFGAASDFELLWNDFSDGWRLSD